jgi:alpha-N-arabinofuranosidase
MQLFIIAVAAPATAVTLFFDVITVMPQTNHKGLNFLRPDIAAMIDDLHPAFVRFPGGCYVEGDVLSNRFNWKNSVGPPENRTGHFNGVWNYYTETGLGAFEYYNGLRH